MVREQVNKEVAADVLAAKSQLEVLLKQINDGHLDDIREAGLLLSVLADLHVEEMRWFHSVRVCSSHIEVEMDLYIFKLFLCERKLQIAAFINDDPDLSFSFFENLVSGSQEGGINSKEGDLKSNGN